MSVRRQRKFPDCNSCSNNKTFPKAWMFDQQIQLRHQQFFFPLYLRIDLTSHHPHFTICCTHRLRPNKPNSPSILVNLVDFPLNFSRFLLFKFIKFFTDKPWLVDEGGGRGNAISLEIVFEETPPISYISTHVEGWFEKKKSK